MIWKPPKIWNGGAAFILGGGSSLFREFGVPDSLIEDVWAKRKSIKEISPYLAPLQDKHVIAINTAYKLGTFPDFLFFGDKQWWLNYQNQIKNYPAIKISCAAYFGTHKETGVRYMAKNNKRVHGITRKEGFVSWNHNSGAASISLAYQLGAKRIILLGFDMKFGNTQKSHWHSDYIKGNKIPRPPFKRHLLGFHQIKKDAKALGIEILNASQDSAIREFPIVRVKEYL